MWLLLRRYVWVVDLIGIGIGAALAGHAASLLIAAAFLPHTSPSPPRAHPARPVPIATSDKSIEAIVARNIFCSTCGEAPEPQRTRRPLTLLAIMFAPPPLDPRWSVAIVRDDEAATVGPYGVGARVGDATVSAIEDVRVLLDVGRGQREFLELLAPRPAGAAGVRVAPDRTADAVRQIGTHRYEVRRAVVDQLLAGGLTPPWPRIVPETRDGAPVGFRLTALRRDSPLVAIGLTNGDLLLQVNSRSLATPDAALAAGGALRSTDHIWLMIERDGRPLRLDYFIR
ncbi:MAG TPA: type II secretion system protein GspC [Polyangia bacterium]|nr:type II secretion system protein GspC [Polyangia bacterium]